MKQWLQVWNPWLAGLVAVLAAANVVAASYLLWPVWQARGRLDDQLHDLQRTSRTLQQEVRSSEALLQGLREVDEFAGGYPNRRELVGIIGRLSELAKSLALQVPDMAYQPTELKETGLTKVSVQMGVEGSYAKIRRFLYELEGIKRYLVIERVSLHDPTGTSALQVALTLAVYVR
jgi:Tfp pilus assembly protein PilO